MLNEIIFIIIEKLISFLLSLLNTNGISIVKHIMLSNELDLNFMYEHTIDIRILIVKNNILFFVLLFKSAIFNEV